MGEYPSRLGISWQELMDMGRENPGSDERFCMSTFALNTTQESNGVSWLHGEVSKKMFAGIWKGYAPEESHVGFVTNGVHMPTWAASEWKVFYNKVLGDDFMDNQELESAWAPLMSVPDEEIWKMRMTLKQKFIRSVPTSSSTTSTVSRRLSTTSATPCSSFSLVRHIPPTVPVRA